MTSSRRPGALAFAGRANRRLASTGRALREASRVVTALGRALLVLAPVTLAAGYAWGWVELVAVGYGLVVLLALAALSALGREGFSVDLDLPDRRVVVGEHAAGRVLIANPLRRSVAGVTLEIPIGSAFAEIGLPTVKGGAQRSETFRLPTSRRGVVRVGPVRTVHGDPVGLVQRQRRWTELVEVYVHPQTIGIPSTSTGLVHDLEGVATSRLSASDIAFHALREYAPGDERRHIHWKASARVGQYMVRQFEETRRSHLVIALSLRPGDFAHDDEFELAVSVAASLGVRAIRDAREVSVVVGERTSAAAVRRPSSATWLSTASPTRLLDEFALVERDASAPRIAEVSRLAGERSRDASLAFLVVGSATPLPELNAAAAGFPPDVQTLAIVCGSTTVPGVRRLAGLTVVTVGSLDALKTSLARSAAL